MDPVSAFRLADGRYVVADGDQSGWHALLVYDSAGQFLEQLGRKGRGPGEFGQLLSWAGPYRGDSIAAYDQVGGELEVFTNRGNHAREIGFSRSASGLFIGAFSNGSIVMASDRASSTSRTRGSMHFNMVDANGQFVHRMASAPFTIRTSDPSWAPYFGPYPVFVVGKSHLYLGAAEDFTIAVHDTGGQLVRTLRRPLPRQPFTEADRDATISRLVERLVTDPHNGPTIAREWEKSVRAKSKWSKFKPAYGAFIEDSNGNLWVEHYRFIYPYLHPRPAVPSVWTVFGRDGQFLGEVKTPASFIITSITQDKIIGIWEDDMDIEHIRVYKLIKGS